VSLAAARRRAAVVLIAALLGVVLTLRLGFWQLHRAGQKLALQAELEQRSALPAMGNESLAESPAQVVEQTHRTVRLSGRWLPERTVYLDNRQMLGRPGFFVVTPFSLEGVGGAVLVQRGWAPRDMLDRTRVAAVPSTAGVVQIEGTIAPTLSRLYEFKAQSGGPIRQNLDIEAFAHETGLSLRPLAVVQNDSPAAAGDGLLRQWAAPAVDVHKHYGYAFQWFALAALMTGLYVWFQLVRPRIRDNA
jgi:surfeit locus 1 family protein